MLPPETARRLRAGAPVQGAVGGTGAKGFRVGGETLPTPQRPSRLRARRAAGRARSRRAQTRSAESRRPPRPRAPCAATCSWGAAPAASRACRRREGARAQLRGGDDRLTEERDRRESGAGPAAGRGARRPTRARARRRRPSSRACAQRIACWSWSNRRPRPPRRRPAARGASRAPGRGRGARGTHPTLRRKPGRPARLVCQQLRVYKRVLPHLCAPRAVVTRAGSAPRGRRAARHTRARRHAACSPERGKGRGTESQGTPERRRVL